MARRAKKPTRKQIYAVMIVGGWDSDEPIPCSSLISAAEAVASLIAEYCPIASPTKRKKVSWKQQRDNMMRVGGMIALDAIPDCQELFLYAETIQALIAKHCSVARKNSK